MIKKSGKSPLAVRGRRSDNFQNSNIWRIYIVSYLMKYADHENERNFYDISYIKYKSYQGYLYFSVISYIFQLDNFLAR